MTCSLSFVGETVISLDEIKRTAVPVVTGSSFSRVAVTAEGGHRRRNTIGRQTGTISLTVGQRFVVQRPCYAVR